MRQVIVGTYEFGYDQAQLVLRAGNGGEFNMIPEAGSVTRIKVGVDQPCWRDVVAVLMHEITELVYEKMCCRYSPAYEMGKDHAGYTFVLRHDQFTEATARVAEFVAAAIPDLAKAWDRWNKDTKARKGGKAKQ